MFTPTSRSLLEATTFALGAFVFTRARGLEPCLPDELHQLAVNHGIPTRFILSFILTYAGDRSAISRAFTQATSGLHRQGVLLRPITRTSSQGVYSIVHEQRDERDHRRDHDVEATASWSSEPHLER
ncbi:MAG: hypothetical protein CSB49_07345 [Proteobacteria bacterium]|nr:MAG: hypothetical protein CSB49_07345 [Pseudomonadota bacterium]